MHAQSSLNTIQTRAVTHSGGPLCILAGAGSGKTRVVIHRIAHLIENEYQPPWSILAVTFTNKAAGEMRSRIEALVPGAGEQVQVGTFHSMAARYLRRFGPLINVSSSFVIYDQDDQKRMMRRIVDRNGWSRDWIRAILHRIDLWQCEGLSPRDIPSSTWDPVEEKAKQAFEVYQDELAKMDALDFGSLLVKWRDLLHADGSAEIKRRTRHLLVDEYQDTNGVQADIVRAFAQSALSVTVVGDDDQAIYGWRGAKADNLRQFVDRTKNASLIRLEENYRSTQHILDAANAIIQHNQMRLGKQLKAVRPKGVPVTLLKCRDDLDEARTIIRLIQDHAHEGASLQDVAILYRTNAHSRVFEDELRKAELPYRLIGGFRFYDRKEIKDVLATLRCAINPKSTIDTLRVLTAVPRGIGAKSLEKIQRLATEHQCSLLEVMNDEAAMQEAKIGKKIRTAAFSLASAIFELQRQIMPQPNHDADETSAQLNAQEAVKQAIQVSQIGDHFQHEGTPEAEGRLENLAALISAAAQYVEDAQLRGHDPHALGFLEAASLLEAEEQNRKGEKSTGPQVTLMTLHAAKGLEFKLVFLVGWEEHGFPHARALENFEEDKEQLEEERRLAYVGITRAQERLMISWAGRRMVQGNIRNRQPSRFLRELPPSATQGDRAFPASIPPRTFHHEPHVSQPSDTSDDEQVIEYDPEFEPDAPAQKRPKKTRLFFDDSSETDAVHDFRQRAIQRAQEGRTQATHHTDHAPASLTAPVDCDDDLQGFSRGMRVTHSRYGDGVIIGFRGAGRRLAALVRFGENATPRVIICRFLTPAAAMTE